MSESSPVSAGSQRWPRRRRAATAMVIAGATLAATALALLPGTASASSHREAPLIAADPYVDNTDTYVFVSPDKPDTVTFVANWFGLQEPNGGPNFYPWATDAHYDINVDVDGDAKADTVYRWDFTTDDRRGTDTFLYNTGQVTSLNDPDLKFRQSYTLTEIKNDKRGKVIAKGQVAPSNTGPASFPDYQKVRNEAIDPVDGGGQQLVTQADDAFFLDLRVFDLLYGGNVGGNGPTEVGQDTLAGYSVNTIALQVPIEDVVLKGDKARNPVIGVWSDTERRSLLLLPQPAGPRVTGPYVQVSRLGNPLVNELVLPAGLKDTFNAIEPDKDAGIPAVVQRVTDPEVPKLVEAIYGIPAPKGPRNDLVEIFLTGVATNAPTLDGTKPPIQADLNSQVLNKDANPKKFRPSEMIRLNTAVAPTANPNRLGVLGGDLQGYPNGRRLADDVVDITIQAAEGAFAKGLPPVIVAPLAAGDAVDTNDKPFEKAFPYVALPSNKSVNDAANTQGAVPPVAGPGSGPSLPAPSVIAGLAALALLGTGLVLSVRNRRTTAPSAATAA
ncbi:MAG: DUF4331 domain-containing protein [Pseudonocardia sp.]|nr:DUF4331 domain-containing protein [Pseudonocardia sp.]